MQKEDSFTIIGENLLNDGTVYGKNVLTEKECETLYSQAFALYSSHSFSEALHLFERLVQAQPLHIDHWIGHGACLQMERKYEKALHSWALAALIEGDNPLPHLRAAECLFSLGDGEEGMVALKKAHHLAKESSSPLLFEIEKLLTMQERSHD